MTTFEILERWAQYTKFDPEQTRFNLLTSEYTLNRCNKRIQELLSNSRQMFFAYTTARVPDGS